MGDAVERLRLLVGDEPVVALAATRVEGYTRRDKKTGKSIHVRTHMRAVGTMSNVELMSEFGNFSFEGSDTLSRMRARNRYQQVEQEIRRRKLVPKNLDAAPANLPRVHQVETITLKPEDHVMLDDGAHKVTSKSVDGDTVTLGVQRISDAEKKFLVRKRSSLINKIVLGAAAFLALAFLAFSAGASLGGGVDLGHEKSDNTIGAPRHGGSDGKIENPDLTEMSPKPAPKTAAGYEAMFKSLDTDIWGAADASLSQELPDGRRVWLYGDTFSAEHGMVHSTAITQDGGNLHVSNDGGQLFPDEGTITKDGKTYDRIFWVEDVSLMDNGNLQVSTMPIAMGDDNVWDFFRIGEDRSRLAEVSVDDAGDVHFENWLGYTERPDLTTDGEDYAQEGEHKFTYQHVVHDIELQNGKWLKTNAVNWDDALSNHIDPMTGELFYDDFRPEFSGVDSQDTGYEPNELNLPVDQWQDFEEAVAKKLEQQSQK